jgi:hypothetical protein
MKTIETKVIAAGAGAGLGSAVGTFLLWLLAVTVWNAPNSATNAASAVAAVPAPVADLVLVVLAVLGAVVSGYIAPHSIRATDPAATAEPEPAAPAPTPTVALVQAVPVTSEALATVPAAAPLTVTDPAAPLDGLPAVLPPAEPGAPAAQPAPSGATAVAA